MAAQLAVSAVFPVLFQKLTSSELLNFASKDGVRSKIKKWEKKLKTAEAMLIVAEEKQLTDKDVKMWLDELQDLAYDVEDILDEYATEALRRELKIELHQLSTSRTQKLTPGSCIGFTPRALWSDLSMRSKIDGITSRLQDLCKQGTELGLNDIVGGRPTATWERPPTSGSQTELAFYGRDEDKHKILKMVLTDEPGDANFGVISIVGMGGVGKTTLARKVYTDKAVEDFNPKAWVRVSDDDFDVMKITLAILESITRCASDLKNLDEVQDELKEKVDGRKFLLVLDDVWSEDNSKWEILRSPFIVGAHGSKIIVTTRHEHVALTMGRCHKLNALSDNDCWSLFRKHAFDHEVVDEHSSELIRRNIVEKCKGLPLATITLGSLLRFKKRDDWLDILYSAIWESVDNGHDIPAALQITYYHLPSHLKRCFAYCAILPKYYEFEEKELVFLWMAEGLIQQSSDNKQLEDLGGEYFHDLLSMSIFQTSSCNSSKFMMHDIVSNLALMVSGNLSFRLEDELASNNRLRISEKTRYASYICHKYNCKRKFEVFNNAKHLRTHLSVLHINNWVSTCYVSNRVVSNLLSRFKKLRVLSLQRYHIFELPESIEGLILLRYLNLSYSRIRSLPESINSMCNLQTLMLRNCCELLKWPRSMGNLIKLRHLDIFGASSIIEMPRGVANWECLRTLSNFIVGKDFISSLKDLKHLKFLCGELHISKLENVGVLEDTRKSILIYKKDLKVLSLEWGSRIDESQENEVDKKTLDMLQPYSNLEELTIKGYRSTTFPSWVGNDSFSKITVLKLEDCKNCTSLPSLWQLGSLKSLIIKGMGWIESIGREFYGWHPFQSLETLHFENLEEWEFWDPFNQFENESFPKLQELYILNCPKLCEKLPNSLPSLKKLVIHECAQLVVSLSNFPTLCEVKLDQCKKIVCSSSAYFESLESMILSDISYFGDWPRLKKVQNLKIEGCKELIELWQNDIILEKPPQGLHSFIFLRELNFTNCNNLTTLLEAIQKKNAHVEELSIERCNSLNFIFRGQLLQSLKKLSIRACEQLQSLLGDKEDTSTSLSGSSSTIQLLWQKVRFPTFSLLMQNANTSISNLEDLYIKDCPSLTFLPAPHRLSDTLTRLHINGCSKLTTLSLTGQLPVLLKHLKIEHCDKLKAILSRGQLPETLETLVINSCSGLEFIVERFHNNKALYQIWIMHCSNLKSLPEGLETLSSLSQIYILQCHGLASFPRKIVFFNTNLRVWIKGCNKLVGPASFQQGGFPNSNLEVRLSRCDTLEALPSGIHTLSSISIMDCPNMSLSEEGLPTKLARLSIKGLKQYEALTKMGLQNLTSLTFLNISGESIQEEDMRITLPPTLTQLWISNFRKLKTLSFKDSEDHPTLECLKISKCPELTSLPRLSSSLLQLCIDDCPSLKEACKRDKGKEWTKIADIPYVEIQVADSSTI